MKEKSHTNRHVCPPWVGHLLASPLRKLLQDPNKILGPYVRDGMTVIDIGCAMGFFSIPMARMVGSSGKVICVDLQQKMLDALHKRAGKAGVLERIETRLCGETSLGIADLAGKADFALAFAVVHEVPDPASFFREVAATINPGGLLLLAEPRHHVTPADFDGSLEFAREAGFNVSDTASMRGSLTRLLQT